MNPETGVHEKIIMAAASDIGTVRGENEDFYFYSKAKKFLVVCDGMGGHNRGALASRIAGETLRDLMLASDTLREVVVHNNFFDVSRTCIDIDVHLPFQAQKLAAGIRLANRHIFYEASNNQGHHGMGTTLAVAVYESGKIILAHVGDSRVYRLRDGKISALTSDHSWLNELIEDQEISVEEAVQFEKKNVLTRALGIAAKVKVDLLIETVYPNDLYLVCTDGLYNALTDELIESVLSAFHGSLQNKITNLVKSAKQMDGSDNITGGLLHISGNWEVDGQYSRDAHTLPEEPDEVTEYLDHTLKTVYQKAPKKDRHNIYRTALLLIILSLLLASVFLYLDFNKAGESVSDMSPHRAYADASQARRADAFDRRSGGLLPAKSVAPVLHLDELESNVKILRGESIAIEF